MPHRFHPNSVHIRNVMLFLFLSGTKPPETHRQLARVYPQEVPSEHTVRNWFKRFKAHNYNLEDEERSQPARVMDLDLLRSTVEGEPFATTREMAQTLGVNQATVVRGLKKLGKVRKLGRWIPHALSRYDKDRRVDASSTSSASAATPALPSTSMPPVFPSFPATGFGLDPATLAALAQLQQQIPTSSALPPFFPSTQQLLQLSAFPGLFPSTTPAAVPTSSAANTSGYPYLPGIMPFINPQLMQQYAALLQAQTQAIASYASILPSTSLPAPVASSTVSTPAIGLSDSSQSTATAPSTSTSTAAAVPATTHKSKSLKKKKEIEKSVMNIRQSASQLVEKEQRSSRKRFESPGSHHSTSGTQPKKRRSSAGKKESSREAKKPKRQNARRAEETPNEDEFSE